MAVKSRLRILPDGREICSGYQWEKRKKELRERAGGMCESYLLPECQDSTVDGRWQQGLEHKSHFIGDNGDPHHIVKRSKARDDRLCNLAWICRPLHIAIDNRKIGGRKGNPNR
jgi:hypothetical protein